MLVVQSKSKEYLESTDSGATFKYSDGWFTRFKRQYKISLRRPTNTAQKQPSEKEVLIQEFHKEIRKVQLPESGDGAQEERFLSHQIANVDQTPLPFSFTQGPTYETTNTSSVWVRGAASGLDKRQCTAQVTIFADGVPRVKPLLVFKGQGKRISMRERLQYDRRVTVSFQVNAWCDEVVMEHWVRNCWKPCIKEDTLLVLDVHRAQKTDHIKGLLSQCKITPVFVPPGCTSIVQPLDVSVNAPLKRRVETAAAQHMQENLEGYLNGKFTAGERRVLLTQWVGQAWEELSSDREMVIRSFKKCGISTAADGSEDFQIHLEGMEDYKVNMEESDESDDEDPFLDVSEEEMDAEQSDDLRDEVQESSDGEDD